MTGFYSCSNLNCNCLASIIESIPLIATISSLEVSTIGNPSAAVTSGHCEYNTAIVFGSKVPKEISSVPVASVGNTRNKSPSPFGVICNTGYSVIATCKASPVQFSPVHTSGNNEFTVNVISSLVIVLTILPLPKIPPASSLIAGEILVIISNSHPTLVINCALMPNNEGLGETLSIICPSSISYIRS